MTRGRVLVGVFVVLAMMSSGCADRATGPVGSPPEAGTALPADLSGSGPGTVLSANSMPTLDRRVSGVTSVAAKIVYTSTSGVTNEPTEVTGTVFAPKGKPPEGGWPIIAYGHPTTGVLADCAPSSSPTLLNSSSVVRDFVDAGYVVAMSDYQGLGDDKTYHPYLDATTVGFNLIDSVRAARKVVADTSNEWAAFGVSQGGQAAWAANELGGEYGSGLKLVGSASVSPALDITGFADDAANRRLSKDQEPIYQALLAALKHEDPDLNLDDYRRGIVAEQWDALLQCDFEKADERAQIVDQITPDDLVPASDAATNALRERLRKSSLPRRPLVAPALVIYGGQDVLLPPAWTDAALQRACEIGDIIRIYLQPDRGHSDVDVAPVMGWIADRFKGDPPPDSCQSFITPPPPPPAPQEAQAPAGDGE
ncbi:putative lipase [Mycobacterium antarcticum]|uniref:lipase family protein n=1 Tax=Mycolicibacterium sp. TUM20985 TaxID=3023370 RepID=UPI002572A398|nr:lipase family protein [Mycolicibacterium sp. TUM20985]BDX33876.1 putative lipase [Mycolicibacterium sp. TUM20985]